MTFCLQFIPKQFIMKVQGIREGLGFKLKNYILLYLKNLFCCCRMQTTQNNIKIILHATKEIYMNLY